MIIFDKDVILMLQDMALHTHQEFSGFGFVEREDKNFRIYDAVILDVGSSVFTQLDPEKFLPLFDRPDADKMKCWIHRHPCGSGVPGPHNWSGTDNDTIEKLPLGGLPELVKWSLSVVLTPGGWVGRVDNHLTKKTQHLEVAPKTVGRSVVDALKPKIELPPFTQGSFLNEFGLTEEEFADIYMEEYGSYPSPWDFPGAQRLRDNHRSRGYRRYRSSGPGKNGGRRFIDFRR